MTIIFTILFIICMILINELLLGFVEKLKLKYSVFFKYLVPSFTTTLWGRLYLILRNFSWINYE